MKTFTLTVGFFQPLLHSSHLLLHLSPVWCLPSSCRVADVHSGSHSFEGHSQVAPGLIHLPLGQGSWRLVLEGSTLQGGVFRLDTALCANLSTDAMQSKHPHKQCNTLFSFIGVCLASIYHTQSQFMAMCRYHVGMSVLSSKCTNNTDWT